jgi:ATP-dependent Clp protease adaptor protein ClpS
MPDTETLPETIESTDKKSQRAPLWKVILHNDNKTTMDFVVWVLMAFFGHDIDKARKLMLQVHETGQGVAGVYPREVAEHKKDQTESKARTEKFPLVVTIEPDE